MQKCTACKRVDFTWVLKFNSLCSMLAAQIIIYLSAFIYLLLFAKYVCTSAVCLCICILVSFDHPKWLINIQLCFSLLTLPNAQIHFNANFTKLTVGISVFETRKRNTLNYRTVFEIYKTRQKTRMFSDTSVRLPFPHVILWNQFHSEAHISNEI